MFGKSVNQYSSQIVIIEPSVGKLWENWALAAPMKVISTVCVRLVGPPWAVVARAIKGGITVKNFIFGGGKYKNTVCNSSDGLKMFYARYIWTKLVQKIIASCFICVF